MHANLYHMDPIELDPSGMNVIILAGQFAGHEGICLGRGLEPGTWAVSADTSEEVVYLRFEQEFGILINKGQNPARSRGMN